MPQLNAYLTFNGQCAEAMRFYERCFGGKLDLLTFAQSPMAEQCAPGQGDRIMHGCLVFDGQTLMASDAMDGTCDGEPYQGMKGCALTLSYPTVDEARRMFATLADGGQVQMPLGETFWADAFGMLVDRYGTPWLVNGGMKRM
jgi:PhnB protein